MNRVVAPEQLEATVREVARALAANVRAASVATKRLTQRASYDLSLERFLSAYLRAQSRCWRDPETKANLRRYRAGRWAT